MSVGTGLLKGVTSVLKAALIKDPACRMVKIFDAIGEMGSEMMGSLHEEERCGGATWVRDGTGESTASSAEREPHGRKISFCALTYRSGCG
jgi:hypothetical protein